MTTHPCGVRDNGRRGLCAAQYDEHHASRVDGRIVLTCPNDEREDDE